MLDSLPSVSKYHIIESYWITLYIISCSMTSFIKFGFQYLCCITVTRGLSNNLISTCSPSTGAKIMTSWVVPFLTAWIICLEFQSQLPSQTSSVYLIIILSSQDIHVDLWFAYLACCTVDRYMLVDPYQKWNCMIKSTYSLFQCEPYAILPWAQYKC